MYFLASFPPNVEADSSLDRYCAHTSESSIDTALACVCTLKKTTLLGLSLYSFRHLGTSALCRAKMPKEQIDYQLGHRKAVRSTQDYRQYEAGYLADASAAPNGWIERVLAMPAKSHEKARLLPPPLRMAGGQIIIVVARKPLADFRHV